MEFNQWQQISLLWAGNKLMRYWIEKLKISQNTAEHALHPLHQTKISSNEEKGHTKL
jgi:hypothetical protein